MFSYPVLEKIELYCLEPEQNAVIDFFKIIYKHEIYSKSYSIALKYIALFEYNIIYHFSAEY